MAKLIGLTGGIAAGKSTVASMLAQKGALLLDADLLGHQVYSRDTPVYKQICECFGNSILDEASNVDRRKLGTIVFADALQMKKLTDIVWPAIQNKIKQQVTLWKKEFPNKIIVVEAAVLIEAGWTDFIDEIWVIYVKPETAIRRLQEKRGLSFEQATQRLSMQLTNEERIKFAHAAIANEGTLLELAQNVDRHY